MNSIFIKQQLEYKYSLAIQR